MGQQDIGNIEYSIRKQTTRREEFLDVMDEIIPWEEWVGLIRPQCLSAKYGRPLKRIEKMLRMYLLQCWFQMPDEGLEDAVYDSYAFQKFVGINFLKEQAVDATMRLHFRQIMEKAKIGEQMLLAIKSVIEENGYIMHLGTIREPAII